MRAVDVLVLNLFGAVEPVDASWTFAPIIIVALLVTSRSTHDGGASPAAKVARELRVMGDWRCG